MGECMLNQKILRTLMENQITAHIIPEDVFDDNNEYHTKYEEGILVVNNNYYKEIYHPQNI